MSYNLHEGPLRIIILDDDHYPDGRVSQRLIPEFKKRGLDNLVTHLKTFAEYREFLDNSQNLKDIGLIIMDSSLEDREHHTIKSFGDTLPYTIDTLIDHHRKDLLKCVMPASGNLIEGVKNNRYAEEMFARRNIVMDWQQTSLGNGGLSEDSVKVCDKIIGTYENKYPGMLSQEGAHKPIEKESTTSVEKSNGTSQTEMHGGSQFWQDVIKSNKLDCDDNETHGLTSSNENAIHNEITNKVYTRSFVENLNCH